MWILNSQSAALHVENMFSLKKWKLSRIGNADKLEWTN